MAQPHEIVIGSPESDHVAIRVVGRERDVADYWDGNWLVTPISIRAGRFRCELPADLRADELVGFRKELQRMYDTLNGTATLSSLDGWITLTVACEARGHLTVTGIADDAPAYGNKLSFTIADLDQTFLPPIIDALMSAEETFPVIGAP